jgi:zinc transport system substrate-binding protein
VISRLVASLAALTLLATGCGSASPGAAAGKAPVIGSFYPMAWVAERIGGNDISVTSLTKPGAEPHDLELTPNQVIKVAGAKAVLYVKELQPAVDDVVAQHAKKTALDAASVVTRLPVSGDAENPKATYDPHVWLDPSRLAAIARAFGTKLADADPAHAADYEANTSALVTELTKLDTEYKAGLGTCKQKTIVTSHAAFGYLSQRYGLTQVPIAGIDPTAEPSPKRLAELTDTIKKTGVTTVFTETLVSPKVAQTLAAEAGAKTATLDPIEGVKDGSKDDYLSIMRQNLQTLRTALDCS